MRSLLALLLVAASPALAQRDDQVQAYRAMREGRIRPLGDILSRIPPERRRAFIGSEFGGDRYRLKFMDRGAVTAVDVDARTGAVVNDRGPRGFEGRVEAYQDRRGSEEPRGRFDEERARGYDGRGEYGRGYDERRERAYDDRQGGDRRERFEDRRGGPDSGDRRDRGRRYYARPDR